MATAYFATSVDVTDYSSNYILVSGAGSSPGNRVILSPGELLQLVYQTATGTSRSVTVSGFSGAHWTNSSNLVIGNSVGSSGSRTSASVNVELMLTLSMPIAYRDPENGQSASGTATANLYIRIGSPPEGYPDAFSFTAIESASPSTQYSSNVITLAGINTTVNVSVISSSGHACSLRKNGSGNLTSTTAVAGDTLQLFLQSAAEGTSRATVYVGTADSGYYSADFYINVGDTAPDPFAIEPSYSQMDLNVLCISNQIVIAGLGIPVTASISGGGAYFRLNDQPTTYTSATVSNGTRIKVYMNTPGGYGQANTCSLTVGSMTRSWGVSTSSFDPNNGSKIFIGKSIPPLGLGEVINFFGGPYDIFPPARNLGAYLRGNGYVPPITENNHVSSAAPLNLSQLLNTYHSLYLSAQPAPQETFIDSRWDGGSTITVDGVGFENLGYGNIRNACQYRYTLTKVYGAGGIALLRTPRTGNPGVFSEYNYYYQLDIPVSPNAAAVEVKYTLTIEIYCVLNGQTLTTTKDFYITIYNSWL